MSKFIQRGHNSSSYFWIMPVKIIDESKNTSGMDNIIEFKQYEISIEEDDVWALLFYYLIKYFDDELKENKSRNLDKEYISYKGGILSTFEWNLEYNYFSLDNIKNVILHIKQDIDILKNDYFNSKLVEQKSYFKDRFNPRKVDSGDKDLVNDFVEFYEDFVEIMEEMIMGANEKGYNLISIMSPQKI